MARHRATDRRSWHRSTRSFLIRSMGARTPNSTLDFWDGLEALESRRRHASPGIRRRSEDARAREVLVGATGDGSTQVIFPKLLNAMLGTKFKVNIGYSTSGMRLAVERGEVDGICGVAWETHMASVPHWIIDNKVNFLLQLGLEESPHLRGVPLAIDLLSDPDDRRVFELLAIPQEFGRPIVAPPQVPDRLSALRVAFDE